jgi:hypothetical protein
LLCFVLPCPPESVMDVARCFRRMGWIR